MRRLDVTTVTKLIPKLNGTVSVVIGAGPWLVKTSINEEDASRSFIIRFVRSRRNIVAKSLIPAFDLPAINAEISLHTAIVQRPGRDEDPHKFPVQSQNHSSIKEEAASSAIIGVDLFLDHI